VTVFRTILIANRGEISLRVARTCRELGIRVVAVHSTDDASSAITSYADETVQIGPAPARRSYLNIPAIVEAARATNAEAIHPGYGFLSEDPDFAEVCEANGITFIGPPADVIRKLGVKPAARALMAGAGLPLLPGGIDPVDTAAEAGQLAGQIGFPVVIKAAAGGGGRGIHVVTSPGDLATAYATARAAAHALFGDSRVYLEKYLRSARHVEVQVIADQHGHVVHLGERDCSVQRRHQKLVEETPAPGLSDGLRAGLAAAAVRGARSAGYVGAGTFEFLVDDSGGFYFMEVNCRLQVEHPVTELVTGIDLVREQIRVAAGLPLSFGQDEVRPRGVALECRVNVEDPERDFAPAPGRLTTFRPPGGPFVRVDTHGFPGYRVPASYDSLLAKLSVWAPDRGQAVQRMRRALAEFDIAGDGVHSTIGFLDRVMAHPDFRAAAHDTSIVPRMLSA
jgi:acetyl-CoA carboxylase, biotin carboxylase subunit